MAISQHGLATGDQVRFVHGESPGSSWDADNTIYFVIRYDDNAIRLAPTLAAANDGNTYALFADQGTGTHKIQKIITDLHIGYLYPYEVKLPTLYPTKVEGQRSTADVNSSLVLHRVKFHFGKIGLYETTLERVGKDDYSEVYDSTIMDSYSASRAPYLEEYIKTIPVYEKNSNVGIKLKSSHPAPATLRAMAWEGDYSPLFYKRA